MAKVAVDIGHGSNTFPPSKGTYKNGKGYAEHNFNAKVGVRLKQLLEQNGHTVIMGQQPNKADVPLRTRTNLYNRENVDVVVSIHADANSPNVNGRYYFYWHTSSKGKRLAESIRNEVKAKGYSLRGNGLQPSKVGDWTNLHITREPNAPSVLGENGFMTGNLDFDLIFGSKQTKYVEDIAQAYSAGIIKYLGGTPKTPSKPAPSKPAPAPQPSNSVAGAKLVKNENAFFLATENIKVRNAPSVTAKHTGTLPKGSSINYKKVYEGNGYRWLQYVGNSGNVLYLPYRESGSGKEQWGTFHSTRPSGGSVAKSAPKNVTNYTGSSIVNYLNLKGNSHLGGSSLNNRKKLAQKNGISNYRGTASQNTQLLNKLQGK